MTTTNPTDDTRPDPNTPAHPDVTVQLTGEDGNAHSIIARVAEALRRQVSSEAATAFTDAAYACDSYDALLQLVMRTVTVD